MRISQRIPFQLFINIVIIVLLPVMGSKIPKHVEIEVIRRWLQGKSRDRIAKELQVSTGAVSGIVKQYRLHDPQFDLLREVTVELKNRNLEVQSFTSLIRLAGILKEKDWLSGSGQEDNATRYDKIESLVVALEVFCFRQNRSIEEFMDHSCSMYNTAEAIGVPLSRLHDFIKDSKSEIDQIKMAKQNALRDYKMTTNLLEEDKRNRPLIEQVRILQRKLEGVIRERDKYKIELENEKLLNSVGEDLQWSVSGEELDAANGLGVSLSDLREIVTDLFHHPGKYVEVTRQIIDIYSF